MKDYKDTTLPIEERKRLFKAAQDQMMNPFSSFDPNSFEPLATEEEKIFCNRKRKTIPDRLPTYGLKPKEILEGQMIGMYESKQDLYLLIAEVNNKLLKRIEELEALLKNK